MSVSPAAVPDDTEVVPPKCPEANAASVPDDTEVVPPKSPEANAASVPDDTEVVPPKSQMRIHHPSIPYPLIDDELKKG